MDINFNRQYKLIEIRNSIIDNHPLVLYQGLLFLIKKLNYCKIAILLCMLKGLRSKNNIYLTLNILCTNNDFK